MEVAYDLSLALFNFFQ